MQSDRPLGEIWQAVKAEAATLVHGREASSWKTACGTRFPWSGMKPVCEPITCLTCLVEMGTAYANSHLCRDCD
jgi:hypothetical protein